jgi:DNA-binding MarR family transcriptional regulator
MTSLGCIAKHRRNKNYDPLHAKLRAQLAVLGAIAKQPKGTRVTVKLIASELGISHNTAQIRLTRMERAGLIKRGGWEMIS